MFSSDWNELNSFNYCRQCPYLKQSMQGGPPFYPPGMPPFMQPEMPPFGGQPNKPPFAPPDMGLPNNPSDSGPPNSPPPSFVPEKSSADFQLKAVDPGAIRPCRNRFIYIWLDNGSSFWAWLTFVGRRSVAGWRWNGFFWRYFGIDTDRIDSFICY